jgi:hypothetical protein
MASGALEPMASGVFEPMASGVAAGVDMASGAADSVAAGSGVEQAFKDAAIATPAIMPSTLSFMFWGSKSVCFVENNACAGMPGMIMTPMA